MAWHWRCTDFLCRHVIKPSDFRYLKKRKIMDKTEYEARRSILVRNLIEKQKEATDAKNKIRDLDKEMSLEIMHEKYEQFVGKKVVIHYKDHLEREKKTEIGYIKDFRWLQGDTRYDDGLYPFMYKVRKDGSMSNTSFPLTDNTKAEVKKITRIEVVK